MAATLFGALLGVMVGQLLLAILSKPLNLPSFASVIAVMLGLGAGIDYALLIIGRYREQIAAGDSRRDASAKSAATSGASVVAAGLIVMLAIAGLLVIGLPFIGKLGARVGDRHRRGRRVGADRPADHDGAPRSQARALQARAHAAVAVVRTLGRARHGQAVGLDRDRRRDPARVRRPGHAAAARPARRRQPAGGEDPARRLRPAQRGVRRRLQRPVPARDRHPEGRRRATRRNSPTLQEAVANTPGMATVAPAAVSQDGEMATIFAIPKTAPQDEATSDLLAQPARERDPAGHARTRR